MQKDTQSLILLIDDSLDNQALLKLVFESKGYRFISTPNGFEALNILDEMATLPDLIILDAQMPVMDGYEFRLHQKKNPRLAPIPVIVMSGDFDSEMSARMKFPEEIMTKPLRLKNILSSVSAHLN